MTTQADRSLGRSIVLWLPIMLLVSVAGYAALNLRGDDATPAPLDIDAIGLRFDSIEEMIEASDVIVEGRIVSVDSGRTITDPANPDAGLITALFQLEVARAYVGTSAQSLIIEQESALLDGTSITVNGLEANQVGDVGFWFLIRGNDDDFPYLALVNEQGRLLVDDVGGLAEPFLDVATVDGVREALRSYVS